MKSLHTHRILGTSPAPPVPADGRDQWASLIRIHAIMSGRDPNRLRDRPPDPPRYWSGSGELPDEWRAPTVPYPYSDPDYVRAIRTVLLRDHGLEVEPDPELVLACAVAGMLAGEAARRIAAELAPRVEPEPSGLAPWESEPASIVPAPDPAPAPEPEPERPRKLMEWAELSHSGRFEQARLF